MKKYIDLINAYLNKTLSNSEVVEFEKRLKTDLEFNTIYGEHLSILKGMERVALLNEITKARNTYVKSKWMKYGVLTAIVLFIILMIWLLVFNNENKAKSELRETLSFETELTQSFEVSTDSIITITGEKGTRITINPDDLKFDSGKDFKGEDLTIELIELTDKQDLLLANAQTMSNGKWLISGGAFKIDIKTNTKSLSLKEGKAISTVFPKNTQEENMRIFYGNRTENGYLNWNATEIELKNKEQFVIFCKDTFMLDQIRTRAFGGVETYRTKIKIDTLGFLTNREVMDLFPDMAEMKKQKDTLIIYKEYVAMESVADQDSGFDFKYSIIDKDNFREYIKVKLSDSALVVHNSERASDNYSKQKAFYESINIPKLGWINIDQYYKIEDKVKINLKNNLGFNFNIYGDQAYPEDLVWHETFLIDDENNTLLNLYSSSIEIPRNKSFTIFSCVLLADRFYVCRKAVNSSEDIIINLDYKLRNKDQIKSLFRL